VVVKSPENQIDLTAKRESGGLPKGLTYEKQAPKMSAGVARNLQNPSTILSRLSGQQNGSQGKNNN